MALSTTTVYSNAILNEVMNDVPLKALTPKVVCWNHFNQDSMDGAASLSKEYYKLSDLGAAVAGTEGVDFATVTTLGYDATITVTPTEAAVARADVTTRAMRRKLPGMSSDMVFGALQAGDFSSIIGILEEEAMRLSAMLYEKAEKDCIAQLASYSNTAGSTGVQLTIDAFITALFKLEQSEPEHGEFVFLGDVKQIKALRAELTSNGATADGVVWNQQADAGFVNYINDAARNGLKGSLLGIPMFQLSGSLGITANAGADVVGALIARGQGAPGAPGSLRGPNVFLEGHPQKFLVDVDASARTVELIGLWEYGVAEHTDTHGVTVISQF
mgnify:CR=1 FL=1